MALELANPINSTGNPYNDLYTLPTLAGACLDFFAGVTYLAPTGMPNFVVCTPAMNAEKMDIRANVVAGFPDTVTMIKHVSDGIYVGTTKGAYFLEGIGLIRDEKGNVTGGFSQRQVSSFGVLPGTDVQIDGVVVDKKFNSQVVVLWLTPMGIFCGKNGGAVENLSDNMLITPFGSNTRGSAHWNQRTNGVGEYIVTVGTTTWLVNLNTFAHTRFTNYNFTSYFKLGSHWYGTDAVGLHVLEGATDNGTAIDAYALTPASDFDSTTKKSCYDSFLFADCSGDAELFVTLDHYKEFGPYPFIILQTEGEGRHRCKIPNGLNGVTWQYKIGNVDGSQITLRQLEVKPNILQRSN